MDYRYDKASVFIAWLVGAIILLLIVMSLLPRCFEPFFQPKVFSCPRFSGGLARSGLKPKVFLPYINSVLNT